MTPADLLKFTEVHAESSDEVTVRAAISRAYYAAFHHLQPVVEERVGLPRFGTADDHLDIVRSMRDIDRQTADRFEYLRRQRILADYNLERRLTNRTARECLQSASDVLSFE